MGYDMDKYVITMLGEKDHGKSTLIGNLLIATDSTTQARIAEVKKTNKNEEQLLVFYLI